MRVDLGSRSHKRFLGALLYILLIIVLYSAAANDNGSQFTQHASSVDPSSSLEQNARDTENEGGASNARGNDVKDIGPVGVEDGKGSAAPSELHGFGGEDKVRSYSSSDVLDAAFSDTSACLSPGLDRVADVRRRESFCWVSPCQKHCTLSEVGVQNIGTSTAGSEAAKDADKAGEEVDTHRKPDVQQITETVLEVLPESQKANFALSREGAKVLASNPGAKRVGALLDDDSDTFMRNDCKDNKWVVIELSQVARVSSVEISQHELYSSRVKEFAVYGMQSHPRTLAMETSSSMDSNGWNFIGTFTASKTKGTQEFSVQHPRWVRYLLIRFLTHHGTESVCAINELGVYGTSAAEELEAQLAQDELVFDSKTHDLGERESPSNVLNATHDDSVGSSGAMGTVSGEEKRKYDADNNRTELGGKTLDISGKDAKSVEKVVAAPAPSPSVTDARYDESDDMCLVTFGINSYKNNSLSYSPIEPPVLNGGSKGIAAVVDQQEYLPVPKPKQGGTVYEILVQELRSTKAQQKMVGKALESLHKDLDIVAGEIAQIKKVSGVESAAEFHSKLSVFEDQLHHLQKASIRQSKAAVSLLSAVMGSVTLQMELFKSHSSVLILLARALVILNAVAGSILILKGAIIAM